jgi:hypothetical protein
LESAGLAARSVDGVGIDTAQNVKLSYIFDNPADFEAADAEIPVGARVVRLDEYPEGGAFMTVPDGANMDEQNIWPQFTVSTIDSGHTLLGQWTADRTGYYYLGAYIKSTPDSTSAYMVISVNDAAVYMGGRASSGAAYYYYKRIIQAAKGDVISMSVSSDRSDNGIPEWDVQQCNYIPPKFVNVPTPNVIVEEGGDYSLDEKPVMVRENGALRQKKWIDGKPIWQKTIQFTKNVPAVQNGAIALLTNVSSLIHYDGIAVVPVPSSGGQMAVPSHVRIELSMSDTEWFTWAAYFDLTSHIVYEWTDAGTALPGVAFTVTAQYTKV